MIGTDPFASLQHRVVAGTSMAYVDEGEGDAIVFQHGNPTSSYLWRNVMPHLQGLGRLVACDLVGMGDSGKLAPSGPDRYHFAEQREHLFQLWDELELGDNVVLVLHDWGSALGFDWARQHPDRVQGIAYMEAIAAPLDWDEMAADTRATFQGFRSSDGDRLVLEHNEFVETVLPASVLRALRPEEMEQYRKPYLEPGESRRPTLSFPRDLPISGEPAQMVATVEAYGRWLAGTEVPKLFVNADPGSVINDRVRQIVRTWPNQTEVTVPGIHFVQEDSPDLIGGAIADFVRGLRS